jgi:diacylglycerol O-acyltransferase / wax synthase
MSAFPHARRSASARRIGARNGADAASGILRVMRGELLDRDDVARLWMGTPTNPTVVTALLTLDGAIAPGELNELVRARLLTQERFRQRIVVPRLPFCRPRWRDDDSALEGHVVRVQLGPGDPERALRDVVSRLASVPFAPTESTWKIWLLETASRGGALVVRVHHAVADGLALIGVLLGLSDEGAGLVPELSSHHAPSPPPAGSLLARTRALTELLRRGADAPPALRGRLGGTKRLAWSQPISLADFKSAAHAVEGHVNDLVLGALAGALRRWLARRGSRLRRPIHALVPIALPHEPGTLGNHFASVFAELPVQLEDPLDRVRAARDGMIAARAAAQLSLGRTFVNLAPAMGRRIEQLGVRLMSRRASLVASNVAGPQQPLHVAGRQITSVLFAAPCPGAVALSANTMSYAGALRLTIATDARVVDDPGELVLAFEQEVRETTARLADSRPGTP